LHQFPVFGCLDIRDLASGGPGFDTGQIAGSTLSLDQHVFLSLETCATLTPCVCFSVLAIVLSCLVLIVIQLQMHHLIVSMIHQTRLHGITAIMHVELYRVDTSVSKYTACVRLASYPNIVLAFVKMRWHYLILVAGTHSSCRSVFAS